jgi:arabinofuranosyltransferase
MIKNPQDVRPGMIENARALFKDAFTIWSYKPENSTYGKHGMELKAQSQSNRLLLVETASGIKPFFAGPNVTFIDYLGLTDPLLSRLPVADKNVWHSSHYWRKVPVGYYEYRAGDTSKLNKDLATYYEKIRVVHMEPTFSIARLKAILEMWLGKYEPHLKKYIAEEYGNK